ncbi:MAG TPA: DUF3108 domain-containing protein [Blastocatellia bacterium]
MKRIAFTFGILAIVLGCLSGGRGLAFQDAALANGEKATPAPPPSVNLPQATLRRDFKNSLPIPAGEKLEYEIRFSRFPIYATVGVISFEFLGAATNPTIDGLNVEFKPQPEDQFLRLRASAISKGFLIALTGVDVKDRFETLVNAKDFAARIGFKEIKEGKKRQAQALVFDQTQQTVKFITNDLNNSQAPPKEKTAARESGMLDLLSAIYFVRLQKMKEGQLIRFPVNDDGTNYWFDIVVGKTEKLKTDCGKVKTIRLEPKLFGPGQLISRQGEMTMWVTADDKHIPLKLTAKTASGTVHAKLQNFKNKCKLIDEDAEQKPTSDSKN